MARRRPKTSSSPRSAPPKGRAASPHRAAADGQSADAAAERRHWTPKAWIGVYVVIFAVCEAALLIFFVVLGGDSRPRKAMLMKAESLASQGRHAEALAVYERFGEKWPGAWMTHNFNRSVGEELMQTGDYEKAVQYLLTAAKADPSKRGTQALAGKALWEAGRREEAEAMFQAEVELGGETDEAHFILGRQALEAGDYPGAFGHFQAIRDREQYAAELGEAQKLLERDVLEPARAQAAGKSNS